MEARGSERAEVDADDQRAVRRRRSTRLGGCVGWSPRHHAVSEHPLRAKAGRGGRSSLPRAPSGLFYPGIRVSYCVLRVRLFGAPIDPPLGGRGGFRFQPTRSTNPADSRMAIGVLERRSSSWAIAWASGAGLSREWTDVESRGSAMTAGAPIQRPMMIRAVRAFEQRSRRCMRIAAHSARGSVGCQGKARSAEDAPGR